MQLHEIKSVFPPPPVAKICSCSMQPPFRIVVQSVTVPGKVRNVFSDPRGGTFGAGVDVSHSFLPGFGVGDGQVDDVAFSDMAREHEGCKDREVVQSVFNIYPQSARRRAGSQNDLRIGTAPVSIGVSRPAVGVLQYKGAFF
jgi:hypothetical protein